tara:strand:+ start:155 stop:340 length:186 start_codon:yes stop_codon:yes gene_type:complete
MGGKAPQVSCFNCKFIKDNKCTWFNYFKDEEAKDIPSNIMSKGCKYFCDHPLIIEAIRMFK